LSDNQVVSQATGTSSLGCIRVAFSPRPETTTTEKKSDCDRQNRNILEVRSREGKTEQKEDPDKRVGFYPTYLLQERKKERKKSRKQAESGGLCLGGRRTDRQTDRRKAGRLLQLKPCIVTHQKQSPAFFAVQLPRRLLIAITSDTAA
jgi:hypothetical protein